jgi:hypothetical protein
MSTDEFLDYLKPLGYVEIRRSRLNVVVHKKNPGKPITTISISPSLSPSQIKTICHNLGVAVPPKVKLVP